MHITDMLEPCELHQVSRVFIFHACRSSRALSLSVPSSGFVLFVVASLVLLLRGWRAPDDLELKRARAVAGRRPARLGRLGSGAPFVLRVHGVPHVVVLGRQPPLLPPPLVPVVSVFGRRPFLAASVVVVAMMVMVLRRRRERWRRRWRRRRRRLRRGRGCHERLQW